MIGWALVVLQGVLGGLRVVWLKDELGIIHGTLAQLFFEDRIRLTDDFDDGRTASTWVAGAGGRGFRKLPPTP